jgi:acetylornithine deacetylase/succinyl-diaminopimelate desuccinylase-like protein
MGAMPGWDELLGRLAELPRENGSAALHRTASFLHDAFERAGLEATLVPFTATPYALRLAGVIALGGGLLYLRLMRTGRHAAALATAFILPALLLAQLEFQLPVFGWIGAETQHHVVARLPARSPAQRLLLTAHYDTKTDLLDHAQRAPIGWLAAPVLLLMVLGTLAALFAARVRRGQRGLRVLGGVAAWSAALYGVLGFLALSAGVFVPRRSPGALDDGASCALLVRLASQLAEGPALERTEVEVILFSAEEVGVQGSWVYAAGRFARPPELASFVVNLEGLGASADHGVLPAERFRLRSLPPDARLVALLDEVHRERFGKPLLLLPEGRITDTRSFLARGVPAATVVTREPGQLFPRGLHSARDDRSRLDEAALDASLAYLLDVVRRADARGL